MHIDGLSIEPTVLQLRDTVYILLNVLHTCILVPVFIQFVYSIYDLTCAICTNDQWTAILRYFPIASWNNKEIPKG